VTDADLRAYLSRKETQQRLRNVVAGALRDRATRDLVGELAGETQLTILDGETRPESLETMPDWVDGVARNIVRARFKDEKEERKVFTSRPVLGEGDADANGRAADAYDGSRDQDEADGARARTAGHAANAADAIDSADADAPDSSGEATPDAFLLSPWLRSRANKDADERALLELLAYKARTKKTYAAIAAERGTTANAISLRIHRLRKKYEAEWQEHKRKRDAMVLAWIKAAKVAGVVVLVAFAGMLMWLVTRSRRDEARPVDDVPQLRPAPTASADPPPDIAYPTREEPTGAPLKPRVPAPGAGAGKGKGGAQGPSPQGAGSGSGSGNGNGSGGTTATPPAPKPSSR
jgi:hypothetical protein